LTPDHRWCNRSAIISDVRSCATEERVDLQLAGKVAMVAASSKGIGRACALGLAREGVKVSICSRDGDELARTAAQIGDETGMEVLAVPTDLTQADQIKSWADQTLARFGGVDILVNNAGGPPHGVWATFQEDAAWEQAFQLTMMSAIRMIRAVIPSMRQRGGGRILNIQSSSVKAPINNLILSNTIRPGVTGLAKSLSRELADDGILVNTICPGAIYTDRMRSGILDHAERNGLTEEQAAAERSAAIPLKRFGTPEEFANMVVFLASGRASYITGSTIAIDGGSIQSLW
jgi:3-oxoacyl-[acyl-carrier protein] reductase